MAQPKWLSPENNAAVRSLGLLLCHLTFWLKNFAVNPVKVKISDFGIEFELPLLSLPSFQQNDEIQTSFTDCE